MYDILMTQYRQLGRYTNSNAKFQHHFKNSTLMGLELTASALYAP